MDLLPQLLIAGVVIGSIYALAALGFVLIYKSSRIPAGTGSPSTPPTPT